MIQNRANFHNINLGGGHTTYQIHAGDGYLTDDGEAVFALAVQNGTILIVRMPPLRSRGQFLSYLDSYKLLNIFSIYLGYCYRRILCNSLNTF